MLQQLITKIEINPKKLFLIDCIGAIISIFMLGIVLVQFEKYFGIPANALYFLAIWPLFYAVYDIYCYIYKKERLGYYLKVIALLNISYGILSVGVLLSHNTTITLWGWLYMLIELGIVTLLAFIEWQVGKKNQKFNEH